MFDPMVTLAGAVVGFVVGLTGMGGGALMTPLLVLLFGVEPLAAVSSDLVASLCMKPVGSAVHLKSGTVHRGLVKWLVIGSVALWCSPTPTPTRIAQGSTICACSTGCRRSGADGLNVDSPHPQ